MVLSKIVIKNFKSFENFELDLNEDLNIIVGDNEAGKSTLLEAINLVFTNQINGINSSYELSPYLFNASTVDAYKKKLLNGENAIPPKILIEAYFKEHEKLNNLIGSNNSKKVNCPGMYVSIQFNTDFEDEYKKYISKPTDVRTVPVEYYEIKWYSFANNTLSVWSNPLNVTLIDTTVIRRKSGADQYVSSLLNDFLDVKERAELAISYRKMKEVFAGADGISIVNDKLKLKRGEITDKELTVSIDVSSNASWETGLTSYLDDIPFKYIGKGEQNCIKMKLALESHVQDAHLILIEEPENHLSFTSLNKLIKKISDKCAGKQVIITTHEAFVLNKLGLEKLILLNYSKQTTRLSALDKDTQDYFKKLPGYDTLRLVLSGKTILVEGPSDELIVQKAYLKKHKKLPIEDGIDVLTIGSLAFKRFLSIAKVLKLNVSVVTDNDGDPQAVKNKYVEFADAPSITIYYSDNKDLRTLEPQIVAVNDLKVLNKALGKSFKTIQEAEDYMLKNKTETALKIFDYDGDFKFPEYIEKAIQ